MKPVHILALVLAGTLAGAVLMKVTHRDAPGPAVLAQGGEAKAVAEAPAPAASQPAAGVPVVAPPPPVDLDAPVEPVAREAEPARHRGWKHATAASRRPSRSRVLPPPANPRQLMVARLHPPKTAAPATEGSASRAAEPDKIGSTEPVRVAAPQPEIPAPTPAVDPAAPPAIVAEAAPAPPARLARTPHTVTLNAGLLISVRLVDGLSTERNAAGDMFTATLDRPLVVDGFVIAERGARVEGRVVASEHGGKVNGGATLSIELTRLHTSDRQVVSIETDPFEKHIAADRRQDAGKVGIGAALGAVIGAIAGGGKGAAIGAGAGGGAGAGDVLLTRKPATLPSETRISFRLRAPVPLTEKLSQ